MVLHDVLLRAESFVSQHGDSLERARCRALVRGDERQRVLDQLEVRQNQGASLDSRGLHAELDRLWVLAEIEHLDHRVAQAICERLASAQRSEGSWGVPSDPLEERVRMTGLVAGCLARTSWGRRAMLQSAGDFLAAHWSPDRVKGGRLPDITSHALFFSDFDHDESDAVLQWCGRELERGFRAHVFGVLDTARVLVLCDAHALPGARVDAAELGACLLNEQVSDGGWGDAEGGSPQQRVAATVHALAALRHFGVPLLGPLQTAPSNEEV